MPASSLTFQKFTDMQLAIAVAEKMREHCLACEIENGREYFDVAFARNETASDIYLKLQPADFEKAHAILEDYYKAHLDLVEKDYYLYEFTDYELIEIITRPDEWGYLDYQLAQQLLKERGREVKPEQVTQLKAQRLADLARPEKSDGVWITIGYVSALVGGFFGLVIGYCLVYNKKTLPDGRRVYAYAENERNHGMRILLLAMVCIVVLLVYRFGFAGD